MINRIAFPIIFLAIALRFIISSPPAAPHNVTLTVYNIRTLMGTQTDFEGPIGSSVYHYAFAFVCAGPPETTIHISHDNSHFRLMSAQWTIHCSGSWYWYTATFYPNQAGFDIDHIVFSGEFGIIYDKLIGYSYPTETPDYWTADLGSGTSAQRLVYDNQRDLVYISDKGNNKIIVFSPAQQQVINTISVGMSPAGLAITPDNQKLYVANSGEYVISVVDLNTQLEIEKIPVTGPQYPPFEIAIVSDILALVGTQPPGYASGEPVYELNLVTRQLSARYDISYHGLGKDQVFRTSRDFSATGLIVEPASSPSQIDYYERSKDSFYEINYGIERGLAINNNGSRMITGFNDCSTTLPNLTVFDQYLNKLKMIKLSGCQSSSLVVNPVNPNYVYATDGRDNGLVDVARLDTGLQLKRLSFQGPKDFYYHANSLTISGDGMWVFAIMCQTWCEPPSKILAVKVGPTEYNDSLAPNSYIMPLPFIQTHAWWEVAWTGTDNSSGIDHYQVEFRVGQNGPWIIWLETTHDHAMFTNATPGTDYYFRVIAFDRAGNVERYPNEYDTFTIAGNDMTGIYQSFIPLLNSTGTALKPFSLAHFLASGK